VQLALSTLNVESSQSETQHVRRSRCNKSPPRQPAVQASVKPEQWQHSSLHKG
jgi:hypothetical protein